MNNSFHKDFTPAIERIFALTDMIHEMRRGFSFTQNDSYSKKRQIFIKYWRDLEKKQKNALKDETIGSSENL